MWNWIFEEQKESNFVKKQQVIDEISELIENELLYVVFQPIFSIVNGWVFGYEALTRVKDRQNYQIELLFKNAVATKMISPLELKIRKMAISKVAKTDKFLFLNLTPEVLIDPSHNIGFTDKLVEEYEFKKENIIFEITEETAIKNFSLFKESVNYYKKRGYKIAIDDFGSGNAGLKMLSIIEPDFVKIDKHFIQGIDMDPVKQNIVESILFIANKMGIKVVAEGIEREEELKTIISFNVPLLQGFLLSKPSEELITKNIELNKYLKKIHNDSFDSSQIGHITHYIKPIQPDEPLSIAYARFLEHPKIRSLPVVEDNKIVGAIIRNFFFENVILGKFGYGMHLNYKKRIKDIMIYPSLVVEGNISLEEVSRRILNRKNEYLYDDIYITSNGKYIGLVPVYVLLDAITERSIMFARSANPLTGLPGNEAIQREIVKRLKANTEFEVMYIDINNFKPYNDHYGFERGDQVIKKLAEIILQATETINNVCFIGHIGGDDFIVLTPTDSSINIGNSIIELFEQHLRSFHDEIDYINGYYLSKNRKDEYETFNLLSLSIAIITANNKIDSYGKLASLATEVKKYAKRLSFNQQKSVIVKDQRK